MVLGRYAYLAVVAAALAAPALLREAGDGGRARAGPPVSFHAAWADPSPHRVLRVAGRPGITLEVLDWGGRGTPLVFLAGYGNTAHVFAGFAPQFRDRFRVLAVTRRGFGASTLAPNGYDNATLAGDVLAVLDTLRLDRPVLVAHSFGGAELNAIAVQRPAVARALVYLDAGFDFAELYADPAWMHVRIPRPPAPAGDDSSPRAATAYAALVTGPGYPEAEVRAQDAWGARLRAAPAFHADSLETWLTRGTPPADFGAIRVPALAIYGVPRTVEEKYPWVAGAPAAIQHQAARRFAVETPILARQRVRCRREVRGTRVVEIPGGRHYVYLSHPREVAAAIRSFAP
jgi:pimeloyl-ACP methyl ester carboxylesterase